MGFLITLLTLILIYYVLKILMRFLAPFLIKKAVNKMQKKAEAHFQQQEPTVKKGETIIDRKPKNVQQTNKNVGEYVDFEEVE